MGNDPMTAPPPGGTGGKDYLIIAGQGRSGSNRILDVFDCHPRTFCRNEANAVAGSALAPLLPGFFPSGDPAFAARWREAFAAACGELSVRDRITGARKTWVNPIRGTLSASVLRRDKLRRALGVVAPPAQVWPAATLGYADAARLREAYPVFKILLCSGWILDAFEREPGMRVILNIRAPKAFLLSWRHRYVGVHAPAETAFGQNMQGMKKILAHFGRDDAALSGYSEAALLRSELWRWRYINEALFAPFAGRERFTTVTYERYDADPSGEARRLFAFAGLGLDVATEKRIAALRNSLFPDKAPPYPHAALLDDIVEEVLAGSPLKALWAETP